MTERAKAGWLAFLLADLVVLYAMGMHWQEAKPTGCKAYRTAWAYLAPEGMRPPVNGLGARMGCL